MDMFWANLSPFLSAPCHTATDVTVDLRRELTVFTLIYCMPETAAVDSLCHMSTLYGCGGRPMRLARLPHTFRVFRELLYFHVHVLILQEYRKTVPDISAVSVPCCGALACILIWHF